MDEVVGVEMLQRAEELPHDLCQCVQSLGTCQYPAGGRMWARRQRERSAREQRFECDVRRRQWERAEEPADLWARRQGGEDAGFRLAEGGVRGVVAFYCNCCAGCGVAEVGATEVAGAEEGGDRVAWDCGEGVGGGGGGGGGRGGAGRGGGFVGCPFRHAAF